MALPKWTTPDQLEFLKTEDKSWAIIKAWSTTLKGFYTQTAKKFLERWPTEPDKILLAEAGGDVARAKQLAEEQLLGVRVMTCTTLTPSDFLPQRIENWFSNAHCKLKPASVVAEPLLDLAGKNSRKKPPLQKWQAFSALYYCPLGSLLCKEVKALFENRNNPATVTFLADFLPPGTNIQTIDHLTFFSAFLCQRCTRLSPNEEDEVQAYIEELLTGGRTPGPPMVP